jgi:hypothetical protein
MFQIAHIFELQPNHSIRRADFTESPLARQTIRRLVRPDGQGFSSAWGDPVDLALQPDVEGPDAGAPSRPREGG